MPFCLLNKCDILIVNYALTTKEIAATMLKHWLNCNVSASPYQKATGYALLIVEEHKSRNPSRAKQKLRQWLRLCYCSSAYVQGRIRGGAYSSTEDLYQGEKFPTRWKIKAGDFGEAVGHYLLESHPSFGFWLPVLRLRHKPDPEGSPHGFDLLGFLLKEESGIDLLCIGEVRLRSTTSGTAQTIVRGHKKLREYSRSREIRSVGRLAHWLHDENRIEDMDKLARFSDPWGPAFKRRYAFIGILDDRIGINRMVKAMNDSENVLPDFTACLTIVNSLRNKVEEVYAP